MKPLKYVSSLSLISTNYALRCDAKLADPPFLEREKSIRSKPFTELGWFFPTPIVKGVQPTYLDMATSDSIPVVNTLSIRNLVVNPDLCRHISQEEFEGISEQRILQIGDVLLTVDGGVSIGKPALFSEPGPFTLDSHVWILRPIGLSPINLLYLLASPWAQMQFRRAESGASGQTTVTEDDFRRFIFPLKMIEALDKVVPHLETERQEITSIRRQMDEREEAMWARLSTL